MSNVGRSLTKEDDKEKMGKSNIRYSRGRLLGGLGAKKSAQWNGRQLTWVLRAHSGLRLGLSRSTKTAEYDQRRVTT